MGGSKVTSKIPDPIARMRNTIVKMLTKRNTLPKIIVVIPENDIIAGIEDKDGQSIHFGQAIEWLVDEFVDVLDKYKGYIPKKAKKGRSEWPFMLWISPSIHENYTELDYQKRKKIYQMFGEGGSWGQKHFCPETDETILGPERP